MAFTIKIADSAQKTLSGLPRKVQRQIVNKIDKLAENPRPAGSELLKTSKSLRRIRSGDYRIIYTIRNKQLLVLVLDIGDRKDIYKKLFR